MVMATKYCTTVVMYTISAVLLKMVLGTAKIV